MVFRQRDDGRYVGDLPALRRVVPYLMPTRGEGVVYYQQRIEVDRLLAWLERHNADRSPEEQVRLFHVFLTAVGRTIRMRPEMNRFVMGRRTYEHRDIRVSFVVKTALTEEAPETEVQVVLTGEESVEEVRALVQEAVDHKRGGGAGGDDRLVDFFASWPRPVLAGLVRLVRWLDYHNVLPRALREAIPLYTSVYVVNAGSIGVDAILHHLYEVGTASFFVSLGKVRKEAVVDDESGAVVARDCVNVAYTLDERASDGFYFARSAEVFRRLLAHPEMLAHPDLTVEQVIDGWPPPEAPE